MDKKKKFKFKKYNLPVEDLTDTEYDYYVEKNIRINDDYLYFCIAGEKDRYNIDVSFGKLNEQIRDKSIKTRKDAIERVRKELYDYFDKSKERALGIIDNVDIDVN